MKIQIKIPKLMADQTVKSLLEEQWLVPRKVRHFLRTKKHVLVNQVNVTWQTKVRSGDLVELIFDEDDYPEKSILMGDKGLVSCLYEDEHLIVVNKPEGMKTHGNEPTELALLNHVSAYTGQTCYIIHRLDMETSGLVMFAKNPFVLPILNRLLEDKRISRSYWAVVEGCFSKKEQVYRDKIGRHRHDRRKRVVDPVQGQSALTKVRGLKYFESYTLVNCHLGTGRTHQIRVHLSHHGYAILGDPLYNRLSSRLMLHAHELRFTHPLTLDELCLRAGSDSFEAVLSQLS